MSKAEKVDSEMSVSHKEQVVAGSDASSDDSLTMAETNSAVGKLRNPLAGFSRSRLQRMGEDFANNHGLAEHTELFVKAAQVAQDPTNFENIEALSMEDRDALRREYTHRWDQPKTLYYTICLCSVAAAVQGMDESVISGSVLFYPTYFGISTDAAVVGATVAARNEWLVGLVNGAPYLCCGILGCWLTDPLNRRLGRKGAILVTAILSGLACFWGALTNTWWHLLISRFVLGLGIGPKSSTVPVFAAECSPPAIRGAMASMWQMMVAFGIFLGYAADLALLNVPDHGSVTGLNWRLMLGSAGLPAVILAAQVLFVPESPRWLISKNRFPEAFKSLCALRKHQLQAARDLFYTALLLEQEQDLAKLAKGNRFVELFTVPRNRRAALASFIVMFMQQFCGVNVIVYYCSSVFVSSGFTNQQAFGASLGFGIINALVALPAIYTIDIFGRRPLLLWTFPFMTLFLLMTGFAFWIEDLTTRVAVVALGIYLFDIAYSPGEGPVPFTYSAEAFPLYVRDLGMSLATATTWFFNFVVALTFPRLNTAFTPQGAFGWYAAWNVVGFFAILFFVPETKSLTLEELDQVFSVSTRKHASYQFRQIPWLFNKYILRRDVPQEHLYPWESVEGQALRGMKEKDSVQTVSATMA
ncbi:proton myo-inositol cotransporter [Mycena rosella]|uniref:Proton myo-inositol cotransporter n=1 Tax=Mycena rosella TaxID=1033263 RepID=A0AAD7DXE4_MYCRO|nr:proton myo-inositol cotransporter [Mycena rosella]